MVNTVSFVAACPAPGASFQITTRNAIHLCNIFPGGNSVDFSLQELKYSRARNDLLMRLYVRLLLLYITHNVMLDL